MVSAIGAKLAHHYLIVDIWVNFLQYTWFAKCVDILELLQNLIYMIFIYR